MGWQGRWWSPCCIPAVYICSALGRTLQVLTWKRRSRPGKGCAGLQCHWDPNPGLLAGRPELFLRPPWEVFLPEGEGQRLSQDLPPPPHCVSFVTALGEGGNVTCQPTLQTLSQVCYRILMPAAPISSSLPPTECSLPTRHRECFQGHPDPKPLSLDFPLSWALSYPQRLSPRGHFCCWSGAHGPDKLI